MVELKFFYFFNVFFFQNFCVALELKQPLFFRISLSKTHYLFSVYAFINKTGFFVMKHFNRNLWAISKSPHWHLDISIGIDVGIGVGIAKNLFCLAKSLFLLFEVLYEENIHGEVLFKYTC